MDVIRKFFDSFHRYEVPYTVEAIPELFRDIHDPKSRETLMLSECPDQIALLEDNSLSHYGGAPLYNHAHQRRFRWN